MVNSWCDRAVTAGRKPTRNERSKAISGLVQALAEMVESARRSKVTGLPLLGNSPRALSEWMGKMLLGLLFPVGCEFASGTEDRWTMQQELTKLAFALAAYRGRQGRLSRQPRRIDDQVCQNAAEDIFNTMPSCITRARATATCSTALASTARDDGGKGYDDRKNNEDWDDLAIRMSPADSR